MATNLKKQTTLQNSSQFDTLLRKLRMTAKRQQEALEQTNAQIEVIERTIEDLFTKS